MSDISTLLPCPQPVRFLDPDGSPARPTAEEEAVREARGYAIPSDEDLLQVWRGMVVGRRFDAQATALTKQVRQEAEDFAADVRTRMHAEPQVDPMTLFEHVYAEPTPQLREQAAMVRAEIAGSAHAAHGAPETEEATR